ncbi:MAG: NAD(+) synthase [Gammaproteobacteria bacterium]|nr:NAD(+) synthase [Gammaproteobacteria bacterium]
MDYTQYGFVRLAAAAPPLQLANPAANGGIIVETYEALAGAGAAVVLFPELSITGYSCEDLFATDELKSAAVAALRQVAAATGNAALVVGAPWCLTDGRLLNCAFVCANGKVVGAVPKSAHPNYDEFYEKRWFASGEQVIAAVDDDTLGHFAIRRDQLFSLGETHFAIEVCEDLWAPRSPGVDHALAGAEIILNLSASNELVAKVDYRRDLVRMQSAKLIAAYLYAGSGPSESTKDVVFGGHLIAAENGQLIAESARFQLDGTTLVVEIDWQKLRHERSRNTTFAHTERSHPYPVVSLPPPAELVSIERTYPKHPFVPADEHEFDARATEILAIQATGLARRMRAARAEQLVIGISGGLDSTLAFLVCLDALKIDDKPRSALQALTMPGPGTTDHTRTSAMRLARAAGIEIREIPISAAVEQHLDDIGHDGAHDVTFENAQARERTQILFDTANQVGGIVVGTGDLSELALGWCTFNADQMANYNVNAGVPKTMMVYLVRWYARHRASKALAEVLDRVLETPITPELVPPKSGEISQHTEAIIGPYELHDYFLFHFIRTGAKPEKIYVLAKRSFADDYAPDEIRKWLKVFFERFFQQQFKRTTLPPGPKVGTVSLSPRGDWRMPDEADVSAILSSIDALLP